MKLAILLIVTLSLFAACGSTRADAKDHTDPPPAPDVTDDPEVTEPDGPARPWEAQGVRVAYSRGGKFLVRWRSTTGEIPKNEHFEVDVWLFRVEQDGTFTPLPGATLVVAGWMPDHGHGMVRRPGATEQSPGHYRVAGMLLHMAGSWKVFFDVIDEGYSERTEFDIEL